MKKNNQTIILLILLALLGIYLFISFLLTPKMDEAKELKAQIDQKDQEIQGMYASILQYETDAAALQETQGKTRGLIEEFYIREIQETYFNYLDSLFSDCDVTFQSIQAGDPQSMDFNADGYRCESPNNAYTAEGGDTSALPEIDNISMGLSITGKYSDIKKMIGELEQAGKRVICDNVSIAMPPETDDEVDESKNLTTVQMSLSFVCLVNMDAIDSEEQFPELPQDFQMPESFIDKTYKEDGSFNIFSKLSEKFNLNLFGN